MNVTNIETFAMKAVEKRAALFDSTETDCFRLINDEADGLAGLIVDRFADYLLVYSFDGKILDKQSSNIGLKKEYSDALIAVSKKLPFTVRGILLKNREKLAGKQDFVNERRSTLVQGNHPPSDFSVKQNGIKVYADLVEGQSTGIFLDMREIRSSLADFYANSNINDMLNLFCYTGLFSIHALQNGVRHALNVDISKTVLSRARDNYILNGLRTDERDFIYGDAIDWLRRFAKKDSGFSMAVIDPPTFARNKKRNFSVRENYSDCLDKLSIIVEGGYIFSSVNTFTVSKEEYMSYHPKSWKLMAFYNESLDFLLPGKPYLKAGLWKVQ